MIPLFKEKKLKPAWNFNAGTLIWRLLFAPHNRIIGETRNQEKKTTTFFCIDIHSGKPLWQNITFDEPWWIGIEAIHEKWMIMHGFVRPDIPEHRGIRVVDVETGSLLWRNDSLSFWFIDNEKLYAHKYLFEKHISCELDIATGEIFNEHSNNSDELQELRQKVLQRESENQQGAVFPEMYDEHEVESIIRTLIQRITGNKAIENRIEYLSHRGILMVSQYRYTRNKSESSLLDNMLSVYDVRSEKTLYNEIIAEGVRAPSPDSFFIKDDFLFFINHQTTLTALRPWKS